ncbi:MAG: rod shape-determining protein MreC [Pseudomonadota bacterium]
MFVKQSSLGLRLLVAIVVIVVLLTADLRYNSLATTRSALDTLGTPIYWVADLPLRLRDWVQETFQTRSQLVEDNERLARENLVLQGLSQQMTALQAENVRLRALLNSSAILRDDVLVAELVGISPDPVRHQLVLNKGSDEGVFVGQALIDADGLMGQIVEVSPSSSRALLITDANHSIPVQVNRNGVRAIAEGTGLLGALEIRHVSATTDIQMGDLLETSGLGGRFPGGYPVAVVSAIERDPGQLFARVVAKPSAALDRSRHVLLVFSKPGEEAVNLPLAESPTEKSEIASGDTTEQSD